MLLAVVEEGREHELSSGAFAGTSEWRLVVDAIGDPLRVSIDGAQVIDHRDATLPAAGRSGMWAPASGSAAFDVFRVEPLVGGGKDRS